MFLRTFCEIKRNEIARIILLIKRIKKKKQQINVICFLNENEREKRTNNRVSNEIQQVELLVCVCETHFTILY